MKLLLTSQGTTNDKVMNELIKLCGKNPHQTKILFITTASKPIENPDYMYEESKRLNETGFDVKEYDIEGKLANEIKKEIDKNDIVFVIGGEPFYLLKVVRETGFDKIIKNLSNDKLYVGASAGTYIVCPSVEMGLWKKTNRNTYGLTDFTGVGLVDFMVMAHYEEKYKELFQDKTRNAHYKVYALTDNQAISVSGRKLKFINF